MHYKKVLCQAWGGGLMKKTGKVWKLDPSTQGRLVYSSFALPMLGNGRNADC